MRKWLLLAMMSLLAVLAGCGGGGATCSAGDSCCTAAVGTTCTPTPPASSAGGSATGSVSVSASSSTVTNAAPATITATVLSAAGTPVANNVVDFSVNATVGKLSATAALTDANGHASVLLSPATSATSGADYVVVTTAVNGSALTTQVGYQLSAVSAAFTSFTTDPQIGTKASPVPAYGQTQLTLTMTGVSSASPANLAVTSACPNGTATISPSTVTNTTGTQTFVYQDKGCGSLVPGAMDTVSASITGSSISPTTVPVYLTVPTVNSVTFVSATPSTIYLKGSGYTESSTVVFEVVDTAGHPLPNQTVNLTLSTFAGGLTMDKLPAAGVQPPANGTALETKQSDANGLVSVIINSGTVPTPVRVIAWLSTASGNITTVSSNLAVVTGLPSQLHFSLAQLTTNIEGGDVDGTTNVYTVHASDRSGNPVPDGTSVVFWSEAGQIQGSATTTTANGTSAAVAQFVTTAPRPADGRVTVLAYAIGEESFIDLNGDNIYDNNEPFMDLGDVPKDMQFDGHWDPVNDEYVSLQDLGVTTRGQCNTTAGYPQFALNSVSSDGLEQMVGSVPDTCDGKWSPKTYVRQSIETVFSGSTSRLFWFGKSGASGEGLDDSECKVVPLRRGPPYFVDPTGTVSPTYNFYNVSSTSTEDVNLQTVSSTGDNHWYTGHQLSGVVSMLLSDTNPIRLNPMPAGSKISATTTTPNFTVTVASGSPVANTSIATAFAIGYTFTAGQEVGNVTVTVTTPGGVSTSTSLLIDSLNTLQNACTK